MFPAHENTLSQLFSDQITAQLKTNGQLQLKEPTSVTAAAEVKEVTPNGITHQPRLYDNVPTLESGEKAGEADTQGRESRRLGNNLRPLGASGQRLEDTNLPPHPPPPATSLLISRQHCDSNTSAITATNALEGADSRSASPVRYNGAGIINNTPPAAATKQFVHYSPKTFDLGSYRQSML